MLIAAAGVALMTVAFNTAAMAQKVVDYDTTGSKGSFGFIPSKSKTDNFKVLRPPTDTDSDNDGIPDSQDLCPDNPDPSCGLPS